MNQNLWKPPPNGLKIFSKNIKYLRNRGGLSQRELGTLLGLSNVAVTFWEKGGAFPNLEMFLKLCEYFGRDPTQLLCTDLGEHYELDVGDSEAGKEGASPPLLLERLEAIEREIALLKGAKAA